MSDSQSVLRSKPERKSQKLRPGGKRTDPLLRGAVRHDLDDNGWQRLWFVVALVGYALSGVYIAYETGDFVIEDRYVLRGLQHREPPLYLLSV